MRVKLNRPALSTKPPSANPPPHPQPRETEGADRNFKGPAYTLGHVRQRLRRDTGAPLSGLGSVGVVQDERSTLDLVHEACALLNPQAA